MSTGTTRDGKPVQANDQVSITGTVVSVSGSGSQASITVRCTGSAAQPGSPDVPYNIVVLATDLIGTQSL